MNEVARTITPDNLTNDTENDTDRKVEQDIKARAEHNENEQARIRSEIARIRGIIDRNTLVGKPHIEEEAELKSLEKNLFMITSLFKDFVNKEGYQVVVEDATNQNVEPTMNNKETPVEGSEGVGSSPSHENRRSLLESSIEQAKKDIAEKQGTSDTSYQTQQEIKFLNNKLAGLEDQLTILGQSQHNPEDSERESGVVIPMRKSSAIEQKPVDSTQETAPINEERGRMLLYDEIVVETNREIDAERRKAKEAKAWLSDHGDEKNTSTLEKNIREAQEKISALEAERTQHVRNKINNSSSEDVAAMAHVARMVISNPNEKHKFEALEVVRALEEKGSQPKHEINETVNIPPETAPTESTVPENSPVVSETTIPVSSQAETTMVPETQEKIVASEKEIASTPKKETAAPVGGATNTESGRELVIELPKDLAHIERLRNKLQEYQTRLATAKEGYEYGDAFGKVKVLDTLLKNGRVNIDSLLKELASEHDSSSKPFLLRDLQNAYGVISSYVLTGGVGNVGGTGLPQEKVASNQEGVVAKSESVTQTVEVSPKENAEEPKQPATAEKEASSEKKESPYDLAMKRIAAEDPAHAERLLNAIGATPEQRERIEKLLGATETQTQKVEQEIKEKDPWVVERASKIGEWYRRLPLKYKLAASAVFVGSASAAAAFGGAGIGMIMGAAFVGSTGQRFLGSLAMFATVEGILTKRSLARNEEEEKILGIRTNVLLGALAGTGVFLGGKLLGDYLSSSGEQVIETAPPVQEPIPPTPQEVPAEPLKESLEVPANTEYTQKVESVREVLKSEALVDAGPVEHVLKPGEGVWMAVTTELEQKGMLSGLNEGHRTFVIDAVKDWYAANNPGVDIDNLKAGDTIRLDIINDKAEMTKIFEKTGALSADQIENIVNNNSTLAEWQAEHPGEQLTTETTDKILNESSGTETPSENFDNIRKDMETTEAISMKTEQIFRANIQAMFGSKGFFGYGFLGTNGEKSVDWLDFKGRAVSEVLSKKFDMLPVGEEGAVQKFGIDSPGAVDKLKGYIAMLIEKAGTSPESNESVEHFSKRAISVIISKK